MDCPSLTRDCEIAVVTHALRALNARDAELTREQHAVRNLGRLRTALEHQSSLVYFDVPQWRRDAYRLPADAQQIGAHAFSETLHALVIAGNLVTGELAWDAVMLGVVDEIEQELFDLEAEAGSLWSFLAASVAAGARRS